MVSSKISFPWPIIAYEILVLQKPTKHEVKEQRAAKTVFISLIFGDTAVLIMYYFKDSKISTSLDDHSVRNACRPKTNQQIN